MRRLYWLGLAEVPLVWTRDLGKCPGGRPLRGRGLHLQALRGRRNHLHHQQVFGTKEIQSEN